MAQLNAMKRVSDRRVLVALPLLIGLTACRTEGLPRHPSPLPHRARPVTAARVWRIEQPSQLLRGPLSAGKPGDFRIDNQRIAAVIAGLGGPDGGALVDASLPRGGDSLESVSPVVGQASLSRPRFARLDLEEFGDAATVRLAGVDPTDASLKILHEYTLHPGSPFVRITTTVQNRGKRPVLQYRVGDRIRWGATVPFAPGLGRAPTAEPALVWLAGWSDRASYAYFRRGTTMAGKLSPGTATVVLETLEVPAGKQIEVQRMLAVGPGAQIADLLALILETQGASSGRLEVTARTDLGDPLPGARLEVELNGRPFTVGRTRQDGSATLVLPRGLFHVRAFTGDRVSPAATASVEAGSVTRLSLRSGPPSRLVFDVREEGSQSPLPVKLTLFGLDRTPTPQLGPPFASAAGNTLLSPTGQGMLPLPPGRYRVVVSKGPEFSLHDEAVTLQPNGGASLVARLRRVVQTPGHLGVDLGQLTAASPGCAVQPQDRILSNLVEGVDAFVSGDRGRVVDLRAKQAALFAIPGASLQADPLGRVTLFPLTPGQDPEGVLAGPPAGVIVQLDAARRAIGHADDDKAVPLPSTVTAMRVLDGQHPENFDHHLVDWLSLVRAGRRVVATGASGSRSILGGEAGYPRTYVAVPKIAAPDQIVQQIVASLREGRAIVSSGPFIALKVDGVGPGSLVSLGPKRGGRRRPRPREVTVEVTVSAAEWIGLDDLTLLVNGEPWQQSVPIPGRAAGVRLQQTFRVGLTRDSTVIVLVRGTSPLSPVVNPTGAPLLPVALTNPVWIDLDGNGRYDP